MHLFKKSTITLTVILSALTLFSIPCVKGKSVANKLTGSLPVALSPENKEIQLQIQTKINENRSTNAACTTKDDTGPILMGRSGLLDPRYRWENFNVYAGPEYNMYERKLIMDAMVKLKRVLPCVNFNLYSRAIPNGDYVHIRKYGGCWSIIGKAGGAQEMNLEPKCLNEGTILHEMIHALGFHHEHSRPDRDAHVTILWQNIQNGMSAYFEKQSSSQYSTFGVPYNTKSIMHYESKDFSWNGQPTIQSRDGRPVGSEGVLQPTDVQKLKRMYKC